MIKIQPSRAEADRTRQVPYLPAGANSSGRDVFLVKSPITIDVNGQVLTGETSHCFNRIIEY